MTGWGSIKVFPEKIFLPIAFALGCFTFIVELIFSPNNIASRILKGHSRGLFV
jgi:hypothetical protein